MTAHLRPSTINDLKRLWIALPVRAPEGTKNDDPTERQFAILESYCRALSEFEAEAISKTVDDLEAGRIDDASKDFCPKPPKLADLVRQEQRRQDLLKAEERRKTEPRIEHRNEFSREHRERMQVKFGLFREATNGSKDALTTLYAMSPGLKEASERKPNEQREKARREGRELLEAGVTHEVARLARNRGRWPEGSVFLWAAEEMWGPMSGEEVSRD